MTTDDLAPAGDHDPELTFRTLDWHGFSTSLICEGPLGAVELQFRPGQFPALALAFHSRNPTYTAVSVLADCPVLGGDCYPDTLSDGIQDVFEPLILAQDADGLEAELTSRYRIASWTVHDEQ
ncbi:MULTISPECIES: hypothetical protein [Amycolatopsis]|uniref:Uncharacterized protein n=1 Tax=Amycolatopsis saalfeldensis TaxID=394193 RepID=A0A1H8YQN1_9PSEU|nr:MULTISPECIES: hypothetical protein [Amycolatopsis]SEP53678.1 hypothetical protein SAMN04489732_129124 [Amycolatopsis saalfeldensis]